MSTESTKTIKGRISNKHGTEADWYAAGTANTASRFVPLPGELIIYDPDAVYTEIRTKFGDGQTPVHLLPWASGCDDSVGLGSSVNLGGTCTIDNIGECHDTVLNIPRAINGIIVTSIKDGAFSGCTSLTSIFIPESITKIGDYAFEVCDSLTDVYYTGSEEDWNNIYIGNGNEDLINTIIHYNYFDDFPTLNEKIGDTTALETQSKEIVGAINELNAEVNSMLGTWVLDEELKVSNLSLETGYAELPVSGTYYCSGKDNLNFTFLFFQGKTDEIYEFGVGNTEVQQLLYFGHGEWDIVAGERKMDILEEPNTDVAAWIRANAKKQSVAYQTIEDASLETENKKIVGAINEINGKIDATYIDVDGNTTLLNVVNTLIDSGKDHTHPNMVYLSTGEVLIVYFRETSAGIYFISNLKTGRTDYSSANYSSVKLLSLINGKILYKNSEGNYVSSPYSFIEDAVSGLLSDMGNISTVLDNAIAQTNTIIGGTE